ncbi:MAG: glycosyltransferase [Halobacteriota archaeon]|nr:glycosyltransferase [Halobacteriota archaeon]
MEIDKNPTLEDVSFIIPTNREKVYTLESTPDECPVFVEREGSLDQARNRGIRKAKTNIVIVCDDDIRFDKDFLNMVLSMMDENTLVGLEDYYAMKWCIGRFMCFYKSDCERAGMFDEKRMKYGGDDTDFCIRMEKVGVRIIRLSIDSVEHMYQEKDRPATKEFESLFYLFRRHPRQMAIPAFKLIFRKLTGVEL